MDSLELTHPYLTHPYLTHPHTGEPLRAVGIVGGRPVWPIMGAADNDGDGGDDAADNDDGTDNDEGTDEGADRSNSDKDDQDARIQRANRQAANYRAQLREAEKARDEANAVLQRLQKAITGEDGESGQDAAELAQRVEALTNTVTEQQAQLLVYELAATHNANPVALLDSRSFMATLTGLDPNSDTYRTEVADAIKDAVTKNAAYRIGQGSSRGGGELDAEQRERNKRRPASLRAAIGGHYGN